MNLSEPAKRFLKAMMNYDQELFETFTHAEKQTFQKLCEDLELEETDEVTKTYKAEVLTKLKYLFSKEATEKRTQLKQDQSILGKYCNLNTKDLEEVKKLEKLTGKDILDRDWPYSRPDWSQSLSAELVARNWNTVSLAYLV